MTQQECRFQSGNCYCAATLYLPDTSMPVPCVVMGHGFSAVRDQSLDDFAAFFCQSGLAVLLFDYRYLGDSEGQPRQLISIKQQHQDWRAAIHYAKQQEGVDSSKIALFGTSLSGGHVQVIAAQDKSLSAVVAQVPFCDGLRNTLLDFHMIFSIPAFVVAAIDWLASCFALPALTIPVVGPVGSTAAMTRAEIRKGYYDMRGKQSQWQNRVVARSILKIPFYRPIKYTRSIQCPILYSLVDSDAILPDKYARQTAAKAPCAEIQSYQCKHFDVYLEPMWKQLARDQRDFLIKHLKPRAISERKAGK